MNNPEKLATFGTQDTRRRQTKQKSQHTELDTTIRNKKNLTNSVYKTTRGKDELHIVYMRKS